MPILDNQPIYLKSYHLSHFIIKEKAKEALN